MRILQGIAFFFILNAIYASYTTFRDYDHIGRVVTSAYEKGNMKKLQLLECKVYGPKDKNIDRGFIYEMKDGKKVVC